MEDSGDLKGSDAGNDIGSRDDDYTILGFAFMTDGMRHGSQLW